MAGETLNYVTIPQTIIRFPDVRLKTRDAHKLRGYFGNLFKERSVLLHNHMGNGEFRYRYPQVQYKVLEGVPHLVGLLDGAKLLPELFFQIDELKVGGETIPLHHKNIDHKAVEVGITDRQQHYRFQTLWMALNQKNHTRYQNATPPEQKALLERILIGNILAFLKAADHYVEQRITVDGRFKEKTTRFKNRSMLAFEGAFTTNITLPNLIGLGKQTARGFGTVES